MCARERQWKRKLTNGVYSMYITGPLKERTSQIFQLGKFTVNPTEVSLRWCPWTIVVLVLKKKKKLQSVSTTISLSQFFNLKGNKVLPHQWLNDLPWEEVKHLISSLCYRSPVDATSHPSLHKRTALVCSSPSYHQPKMAMCCLKRKMWEVLWTCAVPSRQKLIFWWSYFLEWAVPIFYQANLTANFCRTVLMLKCTAVKRNITLKLRFVNISSSSSKWHNECPNMFIIR